MPETVLHMSYKRPPRVLSGLPEKWENIAMEELMKNLEQIGFTPETCDRIRDRYDGNEDELRRYVIFCVALFDNRHECV